MSTFKVIQIKDALSILALVYLLSALDNNLMIIGENKFELGYFEWGSYCWFKVDESRLKHRDYSCDHVSRSYVILDLIMYFSWKKRNTWMMKQHFWSECICYILADDSSCVNFVNKFLNKYKFTI